MSKAAEFDKLASEFKAVLAGQDMLKDEVIQLVTERMMFFVVGNMDLMARALRLVAMVSLGAEEDPDVLDRLTIMCRKEFVSSQGLTHAAVRDVLAMLRDTVK